MKRMNHGYSLKLRQDDLIFSCKPVVRLRNALMKGLLKGEILYERHVTVLEGRVQRAKRRVEQSRAARSSEPKL